MLRPDGLLIDLRAYPGAWPVDVVTGAQAWHAGPVDDSGAQADDTAADTALAGAVAAGWFTPEVQTTFAFPYYWDSLAELDAYATERWAGVIGVPAATRRAARRLLAAAGPGARLRLRRGVLLGRYR